jgi:hypothetical protein
VPARSNIPRLTGIVEAIELIRSEMAGVALEAFDADISQRWLPSAASRSSRRPVGA